MEQPAGLLRAISAEALGTRLLIGGFKVSDAIGSGGANTLGRVRGQRHFPYYFLLGVGKLRLHNLLNFCKNIKKSFNFTSCDQFLGIF
jgi:hypothetical protein